MGSVSSTSSLNLISPQIDVTTIVDALISAAGLPVTRMQSQASAFQSRISAYQTLNTKLSSLLSGVNKLLYDGATPLLSTPGPFSDRLNNSVFSAKTATSSDEDILTATAGEDAAAGSYSITVGALAKAQADVSDGFLDVDTTPTGTGTLDISVGGAEAVHVEITSSNNTLQGVMEAINDADAGVTASIINDGTGAPYKLVINSDETGTAHSFVITDNLTGGTALNLDTKVDAANAQINVNGIDIYRGSNTISDVISGTTLNLTGLSGTAPATVIKISSDVDSMVSAMKSLVSAYNDINSFIKNQTTYNAQTRSAGILAGDASLRNIQTKLQTIITQAVSNGYTSYSVLSQAGVTFNRDGSLTLDETKFRTAVTEDLTSTAALFLGNGQLTDGRVTYNSQTSATEAGTYAIEVTALATRAAVTGSNEITTLGQDELITITYGASTPLEVQLSSGDTLAQALEKVNSALSGASIAATAADDGTGHIRISTTGYGSAESLSVQSSLDGGVPGSTGFGTTPVTSSGTDIAGNINGHAAVGTGLVLTGADGNPEEGLSLTIGQTTTGSYGSITVTSGTTNPEGASPLVNLQSALKSITDPLNGPIHNATESLNQNITAMNERISEFQERLAVQRELLMQQYSLADQALRLLTLNQSSLSAQTASLGKIG